MGGGFPRRLHTNAHVSHRCADCRKDLPEPTERLATETELACSAICNLHDCSRLTSKPATFQLMYHQGRQVCIGRTPILA